MSKIDILQLGGYPEWDETPLNQAFNMHRYFEAEDQQGNKTTSLPSITYTLLPADSKKVENVSSGTEIKAYRIIALPFSNINIDNLFSELGSYDVKKCSYSGT